MALKYWRNYNDYYYQLKWRSDTKKTSYGKGLCDRWISKWTIKRSEHEGPWMQCLGIWQFTACNISWLLSQGAADLGILITVIWREEWDRRGRGNKGTGCADKSWEYLSKSHLSPWREVARLEGYLEGRSITVWWPTDCGQPAWISRFTQTWMLSFLKYMKTEMERSN